jgi:hypothetical protein
MTQMREPMMPSGDVQLLLWDLACVSGTLSEIMTVWRRAMPFRPELQLRRLMQIQDTARQLAADIGAAVGAGTGSSLDPALSVTGRFSALTESIASAQAMTCGPAVLNIGDGRLWQFLRAALHTAATELSGLMPHLVTASD